MKKLFFVSVFGFCLSALAQAQTTVPTCPVTGAGFCGISVPSTTPSIVITPAPRTYMMMMNVGSAAVAWCSFGGTPGVNLKGSFPLAPFGNSSQEPSYREFSNSAENANNTPQGALYCLSDGNGGTTAAQVTAETR